jgi:hypothetical protein
MLAGVVLIPTVGARSQRGTDAAALQRLSESLRSRLDAKRPQLYHDLLRSTDPAQRALNDAPDIQLMFIRPGGMPAFYETHNLTAARTIATDQVWPGGGSGHNLTGSGTPAGALAVWDAGGVRLTHQEFGGRVIQVDTVSGYHYHATHVAGTMVAAGVDSLATGMSYEALLDAYDWYYDTVEMAAAGAAGLQISNHSYGFTSGWRLSGEDWYWYGDLDVSTVEDYGFGFYGDEARAFDEIAHNAPLYLICKSAGNERNDPGPTPGDGHYHWDNVGDEWVWDTDTHNGDGAPDGYDCVSWFGNAKNILTVGAVKDIPGGYTQPSDVVVTDYSSWGPSDDGRIKPDIVANGNTVYSTGHLGNQHYRTLGGTSMSTPSSAGSINLLAQYYESVHAPTPRSATLKALVINTADEAGTADGPDYEHGWGLMNTALAADVVAAAPYDTMGVDEATLDDGETDYYYFILSSPADLRVTVAWTDPPGTPTAPALDPPTPMLVNNLDLLLERLDVPATYDPWVLDPANPSNAATKNTNWVDNVEQVDVTGAPAGTYRVVVSHTGTLDGGSQDYSIVWRGMSAPWPSTGVDDNPGRAPAFALAEPFPNPTGGTATISYSLDRRGPLTIAVYDVKGRRVATLIDTGAHPAGPATVTLDATRLATGVYFVRMNSKLGSVSRKVMIVR